MKILFLTPFVPSKFAGGHNYTRLLLKKLAQNGHHIDLVYFKYKHEPIYEIVNSNVNVLKCYRITTLQKLINTIKTPFFHPIFVIRFCWTLLFYIRHLEKKQNYDLIYLDHPQMYIYGLFFKNKKKILMAHDVMAQRYERASSGLVARMVKSCEKFFMGMQNSTVFSFSEKDRSLVKNLYGFDSKVTNFFIDDKIQQLPVPKLEDYFVFFGKWDRADNLDGMKWFFSEVYHKLPVSTKIYVIGVALPEYYQKELKNIPNVEYLGFVDDPYVMISNAKAMFAPLFSGAGVKVKVVESLACGTPVIGNEISFEGISEEYRSFMITANTPDDYAGQVSRLNFSLDQRVQFRRNFLNNYNSQSVVSFLEKDL